jgi:hypothetical protein
MTPATLRVGSTRGVFTPATTPTAIVDLLNKKIASLRYQQWC